MIEVIDRLMRFIPDLVCNENAAGSFSRTSSTLSLALKSWLLSHLANVSADLDYYSRAQ